jgi:hypothetical protein
VTKRCTVMFSDYSAVIKAFQSRNLGRDSGDKSLTAQGVAGKRGSRPRSLNRVGLRQETKGIPPKIKNLASLFSVTSLVY